LTSTVALLSDKAWIESPGAVSSRNRGGSIFPSKPGLKPTRNT
jgi:hypothetical protein